MQFYVHKNNAQAGPFALMDLRERLQRGEFSYDDLAWREGLAHWTPLREILGGALPDATPHAVSESTPRPAAAVTVPTTLRLATSIAVSVIAFAVVAAAAWLVASFICAVSAAALAAMSPSPGSGTYLDAGKNACLRELPILVAGAAVFSLILSPVIAWMIAYSNLFPWCRAR